ncbi:MAG TPA: alternative ribosome rescue aminoacyl-tRNA hydrolase ArfB [Gemmatimonadales bacterium]|jgi:ribosome-associated protein|nr:alternative ribosome rescue aminoacyl-tRNA hydrolase ArfB [Gemmatimonadales bacterium]
MADSDPIRLSPRVTIPRDELVLRATRSGGPGGQHVNTSSTRIELVWDVAASPSLDEPTRMWLLSRLASRLDSQGQLRLVAQGERSQYRNREEVVARFADIVGRALMVPKKRRATRPTAASKRARQDAKQRRSSLKRQRRPPPDE